MKNFVGNSGLLAKLGEAQIIARRNQTAHANAESWAGRDHFAWIADRIDAIIRDITAA